ncbi:N-acetylmuramic acid 6-phosphate etherase [Cetobacterium sp. 2A]|uniref:N-acetylmuramic acid 6-phosphate etherase n=1 Tax=Cetobacterium sp. 2A TaxID=2754723 RepID=UPI00163BFE9D|nr:N-acetylmuramic acid 6-phosphate etherase [Cetobacterium sp. 2A]MBC2857153.1 N-acetylmuramic acid 6-phosphate etherase [Cetobacterium sp. 2A]
MNLNALKTEQRNENTFTIDELDSYGIISKINDEDQTVAISVKNELEDIAKAVDLIEKSLSSDGRLIYIGAGTSGRLAILDSAECPPTYGFDSNRIISLIAGGEAAFIGAIEGVEDSKDEGVEDLKRLNLSSKDVVVGLAASGRTPYVIEALKYSNEVGAGTISIACNKNTKIGKLGKVNIEVEVGSEAITGSTRMKSGTAQKMILNMLSTAVMVKLGKVYSNLMVNVGSFNEKLIERQKNIVMQATGASREQATAILNETDRDCKLSIFMILSDENLESAKEILSKNDWNIKKALKNLNIK